MSSREPWACLADRGQLSMAVLTKARASAQGMPVPEGCEMLAEVRPDDGPSWLLGFTSEESAETFIREMAPREVRVLVASNENWWQIAGPLRRAMPGPVLPIR